jgi:hypothetical protein
MDYKTKQLNDISRKLFRGKIIVIAIILTIIVNGFIALILYELTFHRIVGRGGTPFSITTEVSNPMVVIILFVMELAVLYFLYKGIKFLRLWIGYGLIFSAFWGGYYFISGSTLASFPFSIHLAIIYVVAQGIAGAMLLFSPSVQAFLVCQKKGTQETKDPAVEILARLLREKDTTVRLNAVLALERIGNEAAKKSIEKLECRGN